MTQTTITLAPASNDDLPAFKRELQEAFALAAIDEFGALPDGPIPSDDVLNQSISGPNAEVLRILRDGEKVGGAVLTIDRASNHNSLDLFFLKVGEHGKGIGLQAWRAIEQRYPETITWQTHTPYFEKRNIHFYVNKCGFRIVEFFNKHHPDPHECDPDDIVGSTGEAFQFEKVMRRP